MYVHHPPIFNPSDLHAPQDAGTVRGCSSASSTSQSLRSEQNVPFRRVRRVLGCLTKSRCLQQVSSGVGHMHELGIGHGDIKPANVLMYDNGQGGLWPKVCDFGMARGEACLGTSWNNKT